MKAYPVSDLEPGKYFTEPVYLDDTYLLLTPEVQIDPALIDRLKMWRFRTVRSSGVPVDTLTTTGSDSEQVVLGVDQDVKETALLLEAKQFFARIQDFVEKTFTTFVTKQDLQERPISELIREMIEMLRSHRKYLLRLSVMDRRDKNYIVDHSSKTAVLALALGMTLKVPAHRLIELGTAALLHEIGMIRLPPQLYMSTSKLTDQERRAITAHPVLGFKHLRQFSFPTAVCLGVLECRENYDGSGYPQKLAGDRISLFARIIMVAGSYAAITSDRPFRPPVDGHAAILELLKHKARMYDEVVLRALLANLSIFPLGTYVELKNGNRGMVVDANGTNARCPFVRVLAGPGGERFAAQTVVDTSASPEYAIVRSTEAL